MKKLFILLILGFSVPALAEIVSTVSFNPSRIGTYKYLKVSRDANFKGGLETPTLNVQSAGEVTMRWDNANTADKYYNVPTVTGTIGLVSVDMPSTTFLQDSTLSTSAINYSAANATDPGNKIDTITMTGGSLSFIEGTTNNDSYVTKMKGNGTGERAPVQFYTTALSENTLNINGNSGSSVSLTDENGAVLDNAQTLGFHLAGVDIPHPKLHTVNKTTSGTKENASLSLTSSGCGLAWVKRTAEVTENGKTANKNVYVLAFDGCSAEGGGTTPPTDECTAGEIKYLNRNPLCGGPKDVCVNRNGAWVWETQTGTFNGYPFYDAYCSKNDYQIYYCGACCQWSDTQNKCVAIGSNLTDLEPTNAKAKADACAHFKSNYPQYAGRTDTGC